MARNGSFDKKQSRYLWCLSFISAKRILSVIVTIKSHTPHTLLVFGEHTQTPQLNQMRLTSPMTFFCLFKCHTATATAPVFLIHKTPSLFASVERQYLFSLPKELLSIVVVWLGKCFDKCWKVRVLSQRLRRNTTSLAMRQRSVQYVMALMICLLVVSHHRCNGVVKAKRDGYEMSLYQRRQAIDYLRNLLGEIDKNIAIKQ